MDAFIQFVTPPWRRAFYLFFLFSTRETPKCRTPVKQPNFYFFFCAMTVKRDSRELSRAKYIIPKSCEKYDLYFWFVCLLPRQPHAWQNFDLACITWMCSRLFYLETKFDSIFCFGFLVELSGDDIELSYYCVVVYLLYTNTNVDFIGTCFDFVPFRLSWTSWYTIYLSFPVFFLSCCHCSGAFAIEPTKKYRGVGKH